MKKLDKYGFINEIVKFVEPIVSKIRPNSNLEFNEALGNMTLNIVKEIESRKLSPEHADKYFTLIDLFIMDNYPRLKLDEEVKRILLEGMILHDYGKHYGADLELLKEMANNLLMRNNRTEVDN